MISRLCGCCLLLTLVACATSDRPLQLLGGAGPVYPVVAREAGLEGEAVIAYDVDVSGRVINARVIDVSDPIFSAAALQAVNSWRFKPPVVDGETVAAIGRRSTVTFRLGDGSEYDRY